MFEIPLWLQNAAISLASGALGAGGLLKLFGERWLADRSAQRLDADRHERGKELEDLKARINRQFDRVTKLSQREFEVLPEIWGKLVDAYEGAETALERVISHADLSRMNDPTALEALSVYGLDEWMNKAIMEKEPRFRTQQLASAIYTKRIFDARAKTVEAHFLLARKGIFLTQDIYQHLRSLTDFIWQAVVSRQLELHHEHDPDVPIENRAWRIFLADDRQKLMETEMIVRNRFLSTAVEA